MDAANDTEEQAMEEGHETMSMESTSQPTSPLSSSMDGDDVAEEQEIQDDPEDSQEPEPQEEEEEPKQEDTISPEELQKIRAALDALIEEQPPFPAEETGFPETFKGSVVIGKFLPINKRNWNDLEITAEDAILDCPSQVVPLLIKKPNVFPSKIKVDGDDDVSPKKKKRVTFADDAEEPPPEAGKGDEAGDQENKDPSNNMDVDGEAAGNQEVPDPEAEAKKRREEEEAARRETTTLTIPSYYKSSVGNMLLGIGLSRATEWFHRDAIKQLHRAIRKEGELEEYVEELKRQQTMHQQCKSANSIFVNPNPYKCGICEFRSDSQVGLDYHMSIPHLSNKREYKCNWCPFGTRDPRTIVAHFESVHGKVAIIESPAQLYECPTCGYESSQKQKAAAHVAKCQKFFNPEKVQATGDTEADYPSITSKPISQTDIQVYEATLKALRELILKQGPQSTLPDIPGLPKGLQMTMYAHVQQQLAMQMKNRQSRGPGRPPGSGSQAQGIQGRPSGPAGANSQLYHMLQESGPGGHTQLVSVGGQQRGGQGVARGLPIQGQNKGAAMAGSGDGRGTFVICEICDGYIRDLEQLRTHMQWIHKVKIHPKMLASRPPLNCQKCQWRFFTDQGLERHLLGAHGLVTSNMQDMVNKKEDGGRCTQCGRVLANKLVAHMSQAHEVVLKPAHLSYKCTVCSATFNLYRLFETHVYMVHSNTRRGMNNSNNSESLIRKSAPVASGSENNVPSTNGSIWLVGQDKQAEWMRRRMDLESIEELDDVTWKEYLEIDDVVENGVKKCLVCGQDVRISDYTNHIKGHVKEAYLPVIHKESKDFLAENDGLVVRSNLPLIKEDREGSSDNVQRLDKDELLRLLSRDYLVRSESFYLNPGVRLHDDLDYEASVGRQSFPSTT